MGIKITPIRCGTMEVKPSFVEARKNKLRDALDQIFSGDKGRIELPVYAYLIEHPKGLFLMDTGFCRDISPEGVYDREAAEKVFPGYLVSQMHPYVKKGEAIHEQLEKIGIKPADLDIVMVSHLDTDHVSGLKHLTEAKRIIFSENEYYWSCRTVYKARQPWNTWIDIPAEHFFFRGRPIGPMRWAYDLFDDETFWLVNVPGYTEGQFAAMIIRGRKYAILAADAAFNERSWRELIVPGSGFDEHRQLKSLKWLKEMGESPDCVGILCSHDPVGNHVIEF